MGLTYPSNKICPRCGTGGYVWYLDNSEYFAKCTNCGHYFREQDFPMCLLDKTQKPITNYDRLVSKSPEELATWLGDMLGVYPFGAEQWNRQAWLDWLRAEAGE